MTTVGTFQIQVHLLILVLLLILQTKCKNCLIDAFFPIETQTVCAEWHVTLILGNKDVDNPENFLASPK